MNYFPLQRFLWVSRGRESGGVNGEFVEAAALPIPVGRLATGGALQEDEDLPARIGGELGFQDSCSFGIGFRGGTDELFFEPGDGRFRIIARASIVSPARSGP